MHTAGCENTPAGHFAVGHARRCPPYAALANEPNEPCHFLLWQPAINGQQQPVTVFAPAHCRPVAGHWQRATGRRQRTCWTTASPWTLPATPLSRRARGLVAAGLQPPRRTPGQLVWLELAAQAEPVLSPASEKQPSRLARSRLGRFCAGAHRTTFWQTVATEDVPALVQATLSALTRPATQAAPP